MFGHEHRLAIYGSIELDNGMKAYARCLGHGGMPVDCGKPRKSGHLQLYDPRTDYPLDSAGSKAGWNGFVKLTVDRNIVTFEYMDMVTACSSNLLRVLERLNPSSTTDDYQSPS